MSSLDVCADALLSGQVCGVGPGASAAQIESVLGSGFIDDVRKQRMRRDFGLVEFYFNRSMSCWVCFGMSVQLHRLAAGGASAIPSALAARYGLFESSLEVRVLADAIAVAGGKVLIREDAVGEFVRYRVRGEESFVHARQVESEAVGDPDLDEVWSVEIRAQAQGMEP